ncbi:MAG: hypothetical protein M1318_09400 [Firmicutes bacterium]|nr:hypothetical protein [Bacillota bacterium]
MNINLRGTYLCSRLVIQEMVKKKSGKIINIDLAVNILEVWAETAGHDHRRIASHGPKRPSRRTYPSRNNTGSAFKP